MYIPNVTQEWDFGCAKAPGFNDRKKANINCNMDPFAIVKPRELLRDPNPILESRSVYPIFGEP